MDKQDKINDLFRIAREQEPITSFDETRERFLNSLGNKSLTETTKKVHFFNLKKWILMLTSIITIASLLFIFSSTENIEKESSDKVNSNINSTTFSKSTNKTNLQSFSKTEKEELQLEKDQLLFVDQNKLNSSNLLNEISSISRLKSGPFYFPHVLVIRNNADDSLGIPKLTLEEIKKNNKQKKEMLKSVDKIRKGSADYRYIPAGSFTNENLVYSVASFYMRSTEVTNLEYRTFLNDLLIQGRTADYLKAKPNEKMWSIVCSGYVKPMEDLYFSHTSYDNYPVVNISREGAEMYCVWLSQEIHKVENPDQSGFNVFGYNDFRIPTKTEWMFAATSKGVNNVYPWGTDSLVNKSGYREANCSPQTKGYMFIVKAETYNTSLFGLYGMSGNVAEMVYKFDYSQPGKKALIDKTKIGTAGGGWMDNAEDLKLTAKDKYENISDAHPNIGFRIVMTLTGNQKKLLIK